MAEAERAPSHPFVRSDRVEGTAVYNANGGRIGSIRYLEIEKVSGQIVYAITSFSPWFAVRADTHTIPWSKLKYDPQLHGYRTDITQEELHHAPEFSRGEELAAHPMPCFVGRQRSPKWLNIRQPIK